MIPQPPPPAVSAPVTVTAPSPREARATMACSVTVQGRLADCRILDETPKGFGYGDSVLKLADQFRIAPATRNGRPVEGKITIPIKWVLADDDRPALPGAPAATAPPLGRPSSPP